MKKYNKIYKKYIKLLKKKVQLLYLVITVIIAVLLLTSVIWISIAFLHLKNKVIMQSNSQNNQTIIINIEKQMQLPDENPTIATVTDLSKLHGQIFFQDAKIGDKVIIYTIAKEVILYRPSTDSIISVAPLTM